MHPIFTEFRFTQARKTHKKLWVGARIKKTYTRIHQAVTEHALTQIMEVIDKVLFHFAFLLILLFFFSTVHKAMSTKQNPGNYSSPR